MAKALRSTRAPADSIENPRLPILRRRVAKSPQEPGIYRWLNGEGTVLYVGKAKNLRNRLRSYVHPGKGANLGPWKRSFLRQIADFEVTVTSNELEALMLETNLIKQLRPKYNVLMKDDKNYIYARVTVQDPYPRIEAVRRVEEDGAKYFGPMLSGGELWGALTVLRTIFPFRTCKMEIAPASSEEKKSLPLDVVCAHKDRPTPCLDFHIGKCVAPCTGAVTPEQYREQVIEGVLRFLKGDYDYVRGVLQERMQQAAAAKKFELAAQYRNQRGLLDRLQGKESQVVSDPSGDDADIVAVAVLSGRADVVLMQQRGGKLIGDQTFSLAGHAEERAEVLSQFLPQYYGDGLDIPDTVIISEELPEHTVLEQWLTAKRGKKVRVVSPERGKKSRLLQLAEKNVLEKSRLREVKWEAEKLNTESALAMLQDLLKLPELPQRIEGYDISHLGGTETVGSMVVMRHGRAANDHYRSFTIRTLKKGDIDDYRALQEVLRRRLRRLTEDLPMEEKAWVAKGFSFGKALKKEQPFLEEIHKAHATDPLDIPVDYKKYLVAREKGEIVALGRFILHPKGIEELRSIWVADRLRGERLGQFIIRKLLRPLKKGKVYVSVVPALEEYYAEMGFRYVIKPPRLLQHRVEAESKQQPDSSMCIVMMYEASQNKVDPSLSSRPDLLVIDGGKGQVSAVAKVLRELDVRIPVIGLAKREEDVFVAGRKEPVVFPSDAPAKFLLMRLRDEAHRFANRHRETRLLRGAKDSALDGIVGIGPKTRTDLWRRFGSIASIRDASDSELRTVLTDAQLQALRAQLP